MKQKKPITLKQFIINNLRKATWKWGPRNDCRKKAKIGYNQYVCTECKNTYANKDTKIDHVNPVVDPLVGFVDFNTYIVRMFCEADGYQLLCINCHDRKTEKEQEIRKLVKSKK